MAAIAIAQWHRYRGPSLTSCERDAIPIAYQRLVRRADCYVEESDERLAEELNRSLDGTCAGRLLSATGTRMYFPKGILSQSAEATERAKRFNATIGMAVAHGEPMALDAVLSQLPSLSKREAVAYAPTAGVLPTEPRGAMRY